MKIAFFVFQFPSVSETFIVNQLVDLIDRGHTVDIYAFTGGGQQSAHKKILDYKLADRLMVKPEMPYGRKALGRYLYALKILWLAKKNLGLMLATLNPFKYGISAFKLQDFYEAAWFARAPEYDIAHVHFAPNAQFFFTARRYGFFKTTRVVVTFHGFDTTPACVEKHKAQYEQLFNDGDFFTANTDYTKELVLKIRNVCDKIEILPAGLDTAQFKRRSERKHADIVHVVFCGRLIPVKAPDLVVEIVRVMVFEKNIRNIHVTIIGEGAMRNAIENDVRRWQLQDYIEIAGPKSQEEIIEIMEAMDVFLLPGIFDPKAGQAEAQGLVIQEAQAMELPVLVSDAGGMKDGLIDGKTGFVVRQGDVQAFSHKLELLIKDKDLRAAMGKAGRDFVVANYDSRVLGDRLESIYKRVLNKKVA